MRPLLLLLPLFAFACYSGEDEVPEDTDTGDAGDTGDTDDTEEVPDRTFETYVDVQTQWTGDTTCFTPGSAWLSQTPDPTCQTDLTLTGEIRDFQLDEPVPSATVQVWTSDDVTATPDVITQADESGVFSVDVMSCSPFGYMTGTPADWEETVDTYEVHQIYGYSAGGTNDATFNSVSDATARLISGLVGVQWDRAHGVIAGTAYDCGENAIEFAQVFIHDGSGGLPSPEEFGIFYFSDDDMPVFRETQPHTNTNGLWVAINVPDGTWTAEMWGWDGAEHVMLGATVLEIKAGSVNISNIYTGVGDGIWYPPSCQTACGG